MIVHDPIWKRILRRPVNAIFRSIEIIRTLITISHAFQSYRNKRYLNLDPPPCISSALVAHVYYIDLWEEILEAWECLPTGSPLIATAPFPQIVELHKRAGDNPLIEIIEHDNRGRDIAPFLYLLNIGKLDQFDAVLKIHTKKSPHLVLGALRRRGLLIDLTGDTGRVAHILGRFVDEKIGLVGPANMFRTRQRYWNKNKARVRELEEKVGVPPSMRPSFFEGSMFWVRPKAMASLKRLNIRLEEFEAEEGELDGTLHHALERVFVTMALADGYETWPIEGSTPLAKLVD